MTVLVTGGAGYIGSHMVHALLEAGDQVVVLDNLTTGFDWAVPPGATLIVGDAGDQSRVSALIAAHRIDAIIHFAASIVVPDSVRDPLGYYRNNMVNSRALVEAAVKAGVRYFIFSSTAAVYGNPQRVPVREDNPTVPTSPYGSSKLMSEIMLRDAGTAHGLRHVILRYFNVAGADPLGRTGQSTPDLGDRAIFLTLAPIGEASGCVHDLRTLGRLHLDRLPRMADFALWGRGLRDSPVARRDIRSRLRSKPQGRDRGHDRCRPGRRLRARASAADLLPAPVAAVAAVPHRLAQRSPRARWPTAARADAVAVGQINHGMGPIPS